MSSLYDTPRAYDSLFPHRLELVRLIQACVQRHFGAAGFSMLDPACGTGFWLSVIDADNRVGVDINRHMLAVARRRLPTGSVLFLGEMTTVELNRRFDLIVSPGATVGHLNSIEELGVFLSRMRAHLADGGLFILGCPLENITLSSDVSWTTNWRHSMGGERLRILATSYPSAGIDGPITMTRYVVQTDPPTSSFEGLSVEYRSFKAAQVLGMILSSGFEVRRVYYTDLDDFPSSDSLHDLGCVHILLGAA